MPSLSLLGQKTCLAGDDLFFSSILFIAIRLLQIAVLIPLTISASRDKRSEYVGCPDDDPQHGRLEQLYPIFASYVGISYPLVLLGLVLEVGICRASGRGTPTQPEKRNNVRRLCHVKLLPLSLFRILAITLGLLSLVVLRDYCKCIPDPDTIELWIEECDMIRSYRTYFRILLSTHCIEGLSVAVITVYFACKCTPNVPPLADAETKWSICCHCCMSILSLTTCCCLGGREVGDYSDIAMVLADYFHDEGTLDVVPSDIVMALLVLLRVQDERREECVNEVMKKARRYQENEEEAMEEGVDDENVYKGAREEEQSLDSDTDSIDSTVARLALAELHQTSRHKLSQSMVFQMDRTDSTGRVFFRPTARALLKASNPADKVVIAEGARFMRYARAMYSWKMDMIEKPVPSCATFGLQLLRSCFSKKNENVEGDNRFGFNDASLESFAQLEPEQLVYASFSEGIGKIPFCVVIDDAWKSVVISIRGTLSLEDAVTDISLRPESMEECGSRFGFDGRLCYAHAGILANSEWVYSELERYALTDTRGLLWRILYLTLSDTLP